MNQDSIDRFNEIQTGKSNRLTLNEALAVVIELAEQNVIDDKIVDAEELKEMADHQIECVEMVRGFLEQLNTKDGAEDVQD